MNDILLSEEQQIQNLADKIQEAQQELTDLRNRIAIEERWLREQGAEVTPNTYQGVETKIKQLSLKADQRHRLIQQLSKDLQQRTAAKKRSDDDRLLIADVQQRAAKVSTMFTRMKFLEQQIPQLQDEMNRMATQWSAELVVLANLKAECGRRGLDV